MKCLIAVSILACLWVSAHAQYVAGSQWEGSREKYTANSNISPVFNPVSTPIKPPGIRMRNAGIGFTIAGPILLVAGVALMSAANYNETTTNSNGTVTPVIDPKLTYGAVLAVEGTGLLVTGIIFISKGSKKYRHYQESKKVSLNMRGAGAVFRVRF